MIWLVWMYRGTADTLLIYPGMLLGIGDTIGVPTFPRALPCLLDNLVEGMDDIKCHTIGACREKSRKDIKILNG